jgi:hypothetical protein
MTEIRIDNVPALILDNSSDRTKRTLMMTFERDDEDKIIEKLKKGGFEVDVRKYNY